MQNIRTDFKSLFHALSVNINILMVLWKNETEIT